MGFSDFLKKFKKPQEKEILEDYGLQELMPKQEWKD